MWNKLIIKTAKESQAYMSNYKYKMQLEINELYTLNSKIKKALEGESSLLELKSLYEELGSSLLLVETERVTAKFKEALTDNWQDFAKRVVKTSAELMTELEVQLNLPRTSLN